MRKWKLARLWTLLVCMALTLTLALAVTACGKQPTTSEPGAAVSAPAGPAKNLDAAEVRATKTLRLAGLAYSNIIGAAGEAADKGLITEAQWARVAASGTMFYSAYHTARLALIQYHNAPGDPGTKEKLLAALANAMDNWRPFASYVAPLVGLPVPNLETE